jgi:hypothetical protein
MAFAVKGLRNIYRGQIYPNDLVLISEQLGRSLDVPAKCCQHDEVSSVCSFWIEEFWENR